MWLVACVLPNLQRILRPCLPPYRVCVIVPCRVRPVAYGEERLREAAKVGFHRALVPRANQPRQPIAGIETIAVDCLQDVMRVLPALQASAG